MYSLSQKEIKERDFNTKGGQSVAFMRRYSIRVGIKNYYKF